MRFNLSVIDFLISQFCQTIASTRVTNQVTQTRKANIPDKQILASLFLLRVNKRSHWSAVLRTHSGNVTYCQWNAFDLGQVQSAKSGVTHARICPLAFSATVKRDISATLTFLAEIHFFRAVGPLISRKTCQLEQKLTIIGARSFFFNFDRHKNEIK